MNVHQNARLTPHSRAELVRRVVVEGQTPTAVAVAFGVTVKTVRKWVARFQAEGVKGLQDRSSRPHRLHRPTPAATVATIEALRRQRWTGQQIAVAVGVSPATISRILRRLGLTRIQALEPATPVRRYEREHPGELIHIDIKKLGRFDRVGHRITGDRTGQSKRRGVGWEFVHVCIDDASRVAFSQILPDEKKESAVAFLKATVAYYASLGGAVKTFSIGFEEESFDESAEALEVSHFLGTTHRSETLSARRCVDVLAQAADYIDEPNADASLIPTYLLSAFTRQSVTVALCRVKAESR